MILELVEYLITPCSRAMRRLGYLRGQLGIKVRHRQCRRAWRHHLQRTQATIRAAALECPRRRKAVILGSGLLLDIPLADLAHTFREVILVDVVHPLRAYLNAARYRNVRLVRTDVSATAADLARIANDLEDASISAGRARGLVATSGLIAQQHTLHRRPRP